MDPRYTTQIPNFYSTTPTPVPIPNYNPSMYGNLYNQPQTQPSIYGRVVDSKDMLKVIDVPMGVSGVFPKADRTEVYVKSWTEAGTTRVDTYKLVNEASEPSETASLLSQMAVLNEKVDKLISELGN